MHGLRGNEYKHKHGLQDWTTTGGVLMIGYELYRLLSMKKDKKPRKKKKAELKAEAEKEEKKSELASEDTQVIKSFYLCL